MLAIDVLVEELYKKDVADVKRVYDALCVLGDEYRIEKDFTIDDVNIKNKDLYSLEDIYKEI